MPITVGADPVIERTGSTTSDLSPASRRIPAADVPDVQAIIRAHADPIERNEAFNAAYQSIARGVQEAIEPGFAAVGRRDGVHPNWFAVGAHASPEVGMSMVAADRTLRSLELLERDGGTRAAIFDQLGLDRAHRLFASAVAETIDVLPGTSEREATAIAVFVSALGATGRAIASEGLLDPRVATAVTYRMLRLLRPEQQGFLRAGAGMLFGIFGSDRAARSSELVGRLKMMCRTYKTLLAEGNQAIFGDIGGSATAFIALRAAHPGMTPEQVLSKLELPESSHAGSRRVFEWALAHAFDARPPTDFSALDRPGSGNDLVRAACALYQMAGTTRELERKNALVSFANNLVAWREQFDIVQPKFEGRRSGEMDRSAVLSALTPVIQFPFGGISWSFSRFVRKLEDRDGNPFTARASEYDWSRFDDRWPAILDAFGVSYANEDRVWRFPDPRVRR